MTDINQFNARVSEIMKPMARPACITSSYSIMKDYADAKKECLRKLRADLDGKGAPSYRTQTTAAVRTDLSSDNPHDGWEIFHRPFQEHTLIEENVVFSRYNHGGPCLQANYYFEWDGD